MLMGVLINMPIDSQTQKQSTTTSHASEPAKTLANRTFGLIFAAIFLVICLVPLIKGNGVVEWAGITSLALALISLILPIALTPLNILFQKFGLVMHKITNPLFMGLVFYGTVLPTGLILRLLGKDPMRRKIDTEAQTYWLPRDTHQVTKDSFDNQF